MKNKVIYYHTQHNRQVRMVDVGSLNFGSIKEVQTFPLDEQKEQAIKDRTPHQWNSKADKRIHSDRKERRSLFTLLFPAGDAWR